MNDMGKESLTGEEVESSTHAGHFLTDNARRSMHVMFHRVLQLPRRIPEQMLIAGIGSVRMCGAQE
jgi:hypothetical protein